ncbi:MAG: NAD(P)-dependent oxidoreductase [Desulfurococcales archaeon]|nr:NAD(P)-dependent oxidoreductase [Desulfurococcales archaeon]
MVSKVAILGTGRMGSAAAERLASMGYNVILWNRTREKAEELAGKINAKVVPGPFDAVQEAEFILLFLSDEDAIYSVMSTFHRMDGAIIINHATITPHGSSRFSSFTQALGGCYVEAPILGGPSALRNGKALIVVAGSRTCKSAAKSILNDLAGEMIDLGEEPEKAAALKLSFNSLLIGSVSLLAEAVLLSESYGVDSNLVKEVLSKTVFGPIAEKYIDRMRDDPAKDASFTLSLAMKDLDYAVRTGFYKGLPQHLTASALNLYRYGVRSGFAKSDYTRIYHVIKGRE